MIMQTPFDRHAVVDRGVLDGRPGFSVGNDWNAKRVGHAMRTFLAIALRGLLVTTTAVAIVAYLLLTNSHI